DGNLWDGLSDDELFRYSYASRESMASKKLAVAESGYLSRQLAEGMYNTLAEGDDCGTERGLSVTCSGGRLWVAALGDTTADPPLALFGSLSAEKPEDDILKRLAAGRVPVGGDRPLTDGDCEALAAYWEGRGDPPEILRVHLAEHDGALALRSPLTCAAGPGRVCRRCMGADLAGRPIWGAAPELVPEGAPVGLTAAQAIGERGTQLAMRRFHQVGGTGSERDRVRELRELLVWGKPLRGAKAPYEECALRGLRELSAILSEEGGERPFGELPQSLVHFELAVKTALDAPGGKLERTVPAEMQHAWLEVASYESFQGVLRSIPARESAAGLKSRVLLNRSGKERDHG
ncbi:MAG: hypothetical protein K9L28_06950, partial [Synergistales bacterium]|nr:hypothetical protein [Synergistales bacterium]